jgi:hypothetical protein
LKVTFGAPFAFACRKEELELLGFPHDDESVVDSFLSLVLPGGLLLNYLAAAKMAVTLEDTLFVHGALSDYYLG